MTGQIICSSSMLIFFVFCSLYFQMYVSRNSISSVMCCQYIFLTFFFSFPNIFRLLNNIRRYYYLNALTKLRVQNSITVCTYIYIYINRVTLSEGHFVCLPTLTQTVCLFERREFAFLICFLFLDFRTAHQVHHISARDDLCMSHLQICRS